MNNNQQALGSFFDQAAAANKFNDQLRSFLVSKPMHTPAEVKEWLDGTLNASMNQRIRLANEGFFAGIPDLSIPIHEVKTLNDFTKSCDSIYQYFLFDQNAANNKLGSDSDK